MKLRTWFTGVIETRTALHVGTGTVLSTATDAPILRGADGLPLIPGSSVKGALRSASERLLRALGHRACVVFGQEPSPDPDLACLTTNKKESDLFHDLKAGERLSDKQRSAAQEWFAPPPEWSADDKDPWKDFGQHEERQRKILDEKLCRACLTWGSPFLAGRVRVPDLRLVTKGESAWSGATEIRDGVGLDRDTGTAADGIKFDLEVLPAGACFAFELIAEPDAERAVAALAVGELLQGNVPLGGRVTRGLGDVVLTKFAVHEVDLEKPASLMAYLTRGKKTVHDGEQALEKLKQILGELPEGRHAA